MNKKKKIIIEVILMLLVVGIIISTVLIINQNKEEIKPTTVVTEGTKLENILLNHTYFEKSKFSYDDTNNILTIDKDYAIYIKSGYYMMNIKNTKEEKYYCNVVDAVEKSFGKSEGESFETCQMTLDGKINLGGINTEFYDNYKVLTVNNNEESKLYSSTNYDLNSLISIDAINYNIIGENYIISSMSNAYNSDTKVFNVCGNVYNSKKINQTLIISTYDLNKRLIRSNDYIFDNSVNKLVTFCTEFTEDVGNATYYKVEIKNET